jgi:hypothetical protein
MLLYDCAVQYVINVCYLYAFMAVYAVVANGIYVYVVYSMYAHIMLCFRLF